VKARILIVDDEPRFCEVYSMLLSDLGVEIVTAGGGEEALGKARADRPDVVITDLAMPGMDGMALLKAMREEFHDVPVVVATAFGSIESAVNAMRAGAFDYVTKPVEEETLLLTARKALSFAGVLAENRALRRELESRYDMRQILGESPEMMRALKMSGDVAKTDTTVLILGESGTGKELVARAVHFNSPRARGPFIPVNCAAIPETLLESELFGHEKGAFTGADRRREGRVESSNGGTLFLDEIGDMPTALQAKILRLLQEKEFQRVGGREPIKADVRFLCATNRDLAKAVKEGKFREDLFYRIHVFPIMLPPLRERGADVLLLAKFFIKKYSREMGKPVGQIGRDAQTLLTQYRWPGNIRELENVIERAVILCEGESLTADALPAEIQNDKPPGPERADGTRKFVLPNDGISLDDLERDLVVQALERTRFNQTRAARLLGLTRATLRYRIEKYKIG
jgi:two-component system, NtrC family, response regulator AtoC